MRYTYFILFLFIALGSNVSYGQANYIGSNQEMLRFVKERQNKYHLRWVPRSERVLDAGVKFGYKIKRARIKKNGERISALIDLTPTPIRPASLNDLKILLLQEDDYDYEDFMFGLYYDEVEKEQIQDPDEDIPKVFIANIALLVANRNFEKAITAGLAFKDSGSDPSLAYEYVISAMDGLGNEIETVSIKTTEKEPLNIKPEDPVAEFKSDGHIEIQWSTHKTIKHYHAYQAERSDDEKKTFNSIHHGYLANAGDQIDDEDIHFLHKVDSIYENYKKYYYRIKGVDYFGDLSKPSKIVEGFTYKNFNAPIAIGGMPSEGDNAKFEWYFMEKEEKLINGFDIYVSPIDSLIGELVIKDLPTNTRQIDAPTKWDANFYRVMAKAKDGPNKMTSPMLVLRIDSTPPPIPTNLSGTINEEGEVRFEWDHVEADDLMGYRVFRANHLEEEFGQLTSDPISNNSFRDTIWAKALNKDIYYTVSSVDTRYNLSEFSVPLKLERVDIIAPASPHLKDYRLASGKTKLIWENSPSDDVAKTELYRKQINVDTEWLLQSTFVSQDSITEYVDSLVNKNKVYAYTLIAIDESGLKSEPSDPMVLQVLDDGIRPSVTSFNGKYIEEEKVIELNWEYNIREDLYEFWIYRAEGDEGLSLLETTTENTFKIKDDKIKKNHSYRYKIKSVFANGAQSGLSNPVIVDTPK